MFSAAVFRDSKAFGKVKAAVARIPRKVNADEDLTDAETLEKFGILEAGADFRIAGPVSLRTDRGVLDVSVVREGLALPSSAVKDARVETVRTEILLPVENLAVFRECARRGVAEKCVLVYSGGFYSRRRMAMLGRVAAAMGKDAKLCHWGDMDLGGVMIFRHIKENCLPGVKPWLMSAEVLWRDTPTGVNPSAGSTPTRWRGWLAIPPSKNSTAR